MLSKSPNISGYDADGCGYAPFHSDRFPPDPSSPDVADSSPEWNDCALCTFAACAKGSKGSSSSSSGSPLWDAIRRGEVGVCALGGVPGGRSVLSGIRGLAIASLDAPRSEPGP